MASTGGSGLKMLSSFCGPFNGNVTVTNFTADGSTDTLEFLVQMPPGAASYVLTRIGLRQGVLTGVAPVFRVSLQGFSTTTGQPDGTIKGATNNAFFDYTPTAGNNSTWQWLALGETYTAAPGELLYIVVAYQSGTIDASNKCTFGSHVAGGMNQTGIFTTTQNNAGVRVRQSQWQTVAVGTASAVYGQPLEAQYAVSLTSATTPNELATKFTNPAGFFPTYQVLGWEVFLGTGVIATATADIVLYDGTTVLQSVAISHRVAADDQLTARYQTGYFDESSLATLNHGSAYRIAVKPNTTSAFAPYGFDVDAAADMDAYFGGQNIHASDRSGGAWTDRLTRRVQIAPIVSDWTGGAGGGTVLRTGAFEG